MCFIWSTTGNHYQIDVVTLLTHAWLSHKHEHISPGYALRNAAVQLITIEVLARISTYRQPFYEVIFILPCCNFDAVIVNIYWHKRLLLDPIIVAIISTYVIQIKIWAEYRDKPQAAFVVAGGALSCFMTAGGAAGDDGAVGLATFDLRWHCGLSIYHDRFTCVCVCDCIVQFYLQMYSMYIYRINDFWFWFWFCHAGQGWFVGNLGLDR